jgi:hypothetical protein
MERLLREFDLDGAEIRIQFCRGQVVRVDHRNTGHYALARQGAPRSDAAGPAAPQGEPSGDGRAVAADRINEAIRRRAQQYRDQFSPCRLDFTELKFPVVGHQIPYVEYVARFNRDEADQFEDFLRGAGPPRRGPGGPDGPHAGPPAPKGKTTQRNPGRPSRNR